MAGSITSSNAVLMLSIQGLYDSPQQIQGFSADDVFDIENVKPAEAVMGVDGNLSAGRINVPIVQAIVLQADSPSNQIFEDWYASQIAEGDIMFSDATVQLSSVGAAYTLRNGVLTDYSPIPTAKKILQPRKYTITWESVEGAPI